MGGWGMKKSNDLTLHACKEEDARGTKRQRETKGAGVSCNFDLFCEFIFSQNMIFSVLKSYI